MRRHWIAALAVVAVAAAACGDGAEDGRSGGTAGAEAAAPEDSEDAFLAFAECMRENGVDMPDPEPGEEGIVMLAPSENVNEEKQRAAEEACNHLLPDLGAPSEEDQTDMEDALLGFAQCMRDHGVDMPDPQFDTTGDGEFSIGLGEEGGRAPAIDPEDPDFQAAQEACGDLLPGFGEAPGGGGS